MTLSNPHRCESGVTLIELLLSVVIAATVVIAVSVFMPKALRSMIGEKERWEASNIAAKRMEEIKSKPFAVIQTTDDASAGFLAGLGHANCDCSLLTDAEWLGVPVLMGMPTNETAGKTSFQIQACINHVLKNGSNWDSRCPAAANGTDAMYTKRILLRVYWPPTSAQRFARLESLAVHSE